jgi:hypothetical protein
MANNSSLSRFIILIPHRDALLGHDNYRQSLFAAGFSGAYSFPSAAPLAEVSRPFSPDELKELARNIRKSTEKKDGRISGSASVFVSRKDVFTSIGFKSLSFFGPALDLDIGEYHFPLSAKEKLIRVFSPFILCAALVEAGFNIEGKNMPIEPALSFRAAALANMAIRPLVEGEACFSFEWRIRPPVWLPHFSNPNPHKPAS